MIEKTRYSLKMNGESAESVAKELFSITKSAEMVFTDCDVNCIKETIFSGNVTLTDCSQTTFEDVEFRDLTLMNTEALLTRCTARNIITSTSNRVMLFNCNIRYLNLIVSKEINLLSLLSLLNASKTMGSEVSNDETNKLLAILSHIKGNRSIFRTKLSLTQAGYKVVL